MLRSRLEMQKRVCTRSVQSVQCTCIAKCVWALLQSLKVSKSQSLKKNYVVNHVAIWHAEEAFRLKSIKVGISINCTKRAHLWDNAILQGQLKERQRLQYLKFNSRVRFDITDYRICQQP